MTRILEAVENVAGDLQLARTIEVAPTLVIGLGGSGTWTVRRLKRLMRLRYGKVPLVTFLCIDCDQGSFGSNPQLDDLTDAERAVLTITNPEQILDYVRQGIGELAKMQDWLPDELSVAILRQTIGAGGIRPVGRFALFASLESIRQSLRSALNNVMTIETQLRAVFQEQANNINLDPTQPRIYIVGSICGGTGSSISLDTAILVREELKTLAPNATPGIVGLFYLPSVFDNEQAISANVALRNILLANAYAALKEIEYFCDPDALRQNPFILRYLNSKDIEVNAPVYDELFLLERGTPDGRLLSTSKEVFELAARFLLSDIGSPVGAHVRSVKANLETVLKMETCPQTGKLRLLNSLGLTAVIVPIVELLNYATVSYLFSFINDFVLGQSLTGSELLNEVNSFLKSNKLEERGDSDDLVEAMLQDVPPYILPYSRKELEQQAGGNEIQKAHYVANWVESEMNRIRVEIVPNARSLAERNKVSALQGALDALDAKLTELTRTKGLRAAHEFVGALLNVFETVKSELTNELDQSQNDRNGLENLISNKIGFLWGLQGFFSWIKATLVRADEDAMDEALRALEKYGNLLVRDIGREAALEFTAGEQPIDGLPAFLKKLSQLGRDLETAIAKAEEIKKLCAEILNARYQITPTDPTHYVLEQWLIRPSEFGDIVKQIPFDLRAHLEELWQRLGSNFSEWLQNFVSQKTEGLMETLGEPIAAELKKRLAHSLNIQAVLEQREEAKKVVQQMVRACQPFWRAPQIAPGGVSYQVTTVVAIPNDAVGDLLGNWLREAGFEAEKEITGYPFSVEFFQRIYGARAFYFMTIHEMRQEYERRTQNPYTRKLLHIDHRFLDLLPDLMPPKRL